MRLIVEWLLEGEGEGVGEDMMMGEGGTSVARGAETQRTLQDLGKRGEDRMGK